MPSPESENTNSEARAPRKRRRVWLFALAFAVLAPVLLTAAGRVTSPPGVSGPPVGHIVYMEADQPSEHTSLLRGMRLLSPNGGERELVHETEPQDVDAGQRTWINQPCASPDGKWVAYEQQNITLQEEHQAIDYQLWVTSLNGASKPRLLLDITQAKLKPFVGLTWTPDSQSVVFLNDTNAVFVDIGTGKTTRQLLPVSVPAAVSAKVSSTGNPHFYTRKGKTQLFPAMVDAHLMAEFIAPDLKTNAAIDTSNQGAAHLNVTRTAEGGDGGLLGYGMADLHWGWSVWGGRKITNLRWSPDGKYVAYSVSKPPFEDELFYVDVRTGNCYQLPVRTGPSAWDWTP